MVGLRRVDLPSPLCFVVHVGSCRGGIVTQKTEPQINVSKIANATFDRVADLFVFLFSISLAIFAMSAVLIVAPIVLAVSIMAGLVHRKGERHDWHPANA